MGIDRIAIIGAGPTGVVALNEFLHTGKDGRSTITSATSNLEDPEERAFKEVVVFDRGPKVGGVWNYRKEADPEFPTEVEEYYSAAAYKNTSINWDKGSVYDNLFTNVPNEEMKFSTGLDFGYKKDFFYPFSSFRAVSEYLDEYAKTHDLNKYVRFKTSVEKVIKTDGKWQVTAFDGTRRYTESFDAVFVANGRMNIPFIPRIEGLAEFAKSHPGVVSHSKEFRHAHGLEGKKVVVLGNSISAVDIIQYLIPISNVILSTNTRPGEKPSSHFEWLTEVLNDPEVKFTRKPRIKRLFDDSIEFTDGSVEKGIDKIILGTGYHTYFPFLDFPENEGKVGKVVATSPSGPLFQPKDLYLFTFPLNDPTIAYTSLFLNPYFFVAGEANAAFVAGIWSGKSLPSKKEQQKWVDDHLATPEYNVGLLKEENIFGLFEQFYSFAPEGRFEASTVVNKGHYERVKSVLKGLFYKFVSGEIDENTR